SAAVQALKAHPVVNARINEGEGTITYFDVENATSNPLTAPWSICAGRCPRGAHASARPWWAWQRP
ncbi:hypothetical protein ACISU4_17715, partial [Streptomyces wuyuanensis]|uniref:hypothetical protein n=1 Tax=Streptomyces wuyuanensis TaxID=1196353 RepID=UPI0038030BF4